jgi:hypothetical protein
MLDLTSKMRRFLSSTGTRNMGVWVVLARLKYFRYDENKYGFIDLSEMRR